MAALLTFERILVARMNPFERKTLEIFVMFQEPKRRQARSPALWAYSPLAMRAGPPSSQLRCNSISCRCDG